MKNTKLSNNAKLNRLNKLYREQKKLSEKMGAEYRKVMGNPKRSWVKCNGLDMRCEAASEAFDSLRRDMPRVKFDMAAGKYFWLFRVL